MSNTKLPALDDESKAMLENQVKKGKPRKFVLIVKGTDIKTLIVFKKGPYGTKITSAKKDGFLGEVYCGIVTGQGVKLTFQVAGNDEILKAMQAEGTICVNDKEPCKTSKVRDFLKDEAKFKSDPEFQIIQSVDALASFSEDDDDAIQTDPGPTKESLVKEFTKISPFIQKAIEANPARKVEILTVTKKIKDLMDGGKFAEGHTALLELGGLLRQVINSGATLKDRMQKIMPRVDDIATFNGEISTKFAAVSQLASSDSRQASQLLDDLEKEIQKIEGKKENHKLLSAASQGRLDWESIVKEKREDDPILAAIRAALLAALKQGNGDEALKSLQMFQDSTQDKRAPQFVRKWIIRQKGAPTSPDSAAFAKDFRIPQPMAKNILEGALNELKKETASLMPGGEFSIGVVNPLLPAEARPTLTVSEADSASAYCQNYYEKVNAALWKDEAPDHNDIHQELQKAFAKTRPFPKPIKVRRGLGFHKYVDDKNVVDQEKLDAYMKPFKDNVRTNNLVPMLGYISTGTTGTPPSFKSQIELSIIAKQGLDVGPYSGMSKEKELLLNHRTLVKVLTCTEIDGTWEVHLEQVLPVVSNS